MEQCYINLAIVWQLRDGQYRSGNRFDNLVAKASPFSLAARIKIETPDQNLQVELPSLFDPCEMPDSQTKKARRVLIRGRAGVENTTLCKKIVHDFLYRDIWGKLFNRVLWLPLRRFKDKRYAILPRVQALLWYVFTTLSNLYETRLAEHAISYNRWGTCVLPKMTPSNTCISRTPGERTPRFSEAHHTPVKPCSSAPRHFGFDRPGLAQNLLGPESDRKGLTTCEFLRPFAKTGYLHTNSCIPDPGS